MRGFFEGDVSITYAEAHSGILPSGILLGGRIENGSPPILEILIDEDIPAFAVKIAQMNHVPLGEFSLSMKQTPVGTVRFGELAIENVPRHLRVNVEDSQGRLLVPYSFAIDLKKLLAFPAPTYQGDLRGSSPQEIEVIHCGPLGDQRCPGRVNVVKMATQPMGILVEVLLDDGGRARTMVGNILRIEGAQADPTPESCQLAPILKQPDSPTRGRLVFALGTYRVRLEFCDAVGAPLDDYSCDLDLCSCRLTAVAPPDSSSESLPVPAAVEDLVDLNDEMKDHVRSTQEKIHRPENWPDSIGENSNALGPRGVFTPGRTLHVHGVRIREEYAPSTPGDPEAGEGEDVQPPPPPPKRFFHADLSLDDGGLGQSVTLARDGRVLQKLLVHRSVGTSPGRISFEVDSTVTEVTLLLEDAVGQCIPNLSAQLDLSAATFRSRSLDSLTWSGIVSFRAPYSGPSWACGGCSRLADESSIIPMGEMSVGARKEVRRLWDPPPEVKGLCRRCHQKLVDSRKRWDGWLGATAPTRLLSTAARFPLAWMGAMFPMTPLGHMMVRWLGPDGKNVVPSIDAVLLVATVGSVFLASVPMAVFLEPILDFVSNDDEDRAPDWRRLLPSLGLGLLLLALSRTLILLDPDLQPLLRRDIAPISALVGGVAGCLISFVGMSAIWFIRADKRAFDVKNHRVTEIIECANQILGARSEEEYMRFLRRIIEDGLRASRYVLYRYDRAHRTYESHIWIGFEDSESDPSPFAPGDPCPPGQVADLGHALLEGTFQWKAIIGADVQDDGSKLCLPIGSQKHPGLLLSVHDFESNFTGRDVIAITEILCSTLSRGWENVSPPDA